jgi:hypothetical protein
MPFKHNASRRHHIPKARRRITNWPAYEAGLRRRDDLTFWLDEAALSGWRAPRRASRGGQPVYWFRQHSRQPIVAGSMSAEIFQATSSTLRTVAVRRRKWNLR